MELDETASHHARVLRLGEGDPIRLFDGRGNEAEGHVMHLADDRLVCKVEAAREVAIEGARVVLVQALAKGDKLDAIVRMATELGVAAVHLAHTDRTVARPDVRRAARRLERLERVAREAARQAGRAALPELAPPVPLSEAGARAPSHASRLVLWERARVALDECITSHTPEVWVCVGPEGGLSETEVHTLRTLGWQDVGLGSTVLRVETAAPVAVALVLDRLDMLRPAP